MKSLHGVQFRQWATQRLKDYLVKGHAINQKRLEELGQMVQLIAQSGKTETLELQEAKGLLEILGNYTKSFVLLNQYDSRKLLSGALSQHISYEIEYAEAKSAVEELRKQLIAKNEAHHYLTMKKMRVSKVHCKLLSRHSVVSTSIPALKNKQLICYTSS